MLANFCGHLSRITVGYCNLLMEINGSVLASHWEKDQLISKIELFYSVRYCIFNNIVCNPLHIFLIKLTVNSSKYVVGFFIAVAFK